jgi:hypothetical protein
MPSYGSFRIADGTLVLAKYRDGTFVQKLMVGHVSATKYPLKVDTCLRCHISLPWDKGTPISAKRTNLCSIYDKYQLLKGV